ncbi:MAG: hypothetical protein AB2A00_37950 [Myxococcota bacterium]
MRSARSSVAVLLTLSSLLACGGRGGEEDGSTTSSSSGGSEAVALSGALSAGLEDESMSESDESPDAFLAAAGESNADADPAVAAEDEAPPSDTSLGTEDGNTVTEAEAQTGTNAPTVFYLTVGWGRFPFERNAQPVAVQGTISVDVGAIVVLRRMALEPITPQEDRIRRDATMPLRQLNLDTTIGCCMDGVALKVILHESINQTGTATPREATLTLALDNGQTFAIPLNPGVETIDEVADIGSGLKGFVQGFQRQPVADCKQGYMLGRWVKRVESDDGRELGRFAGRYVAEDGTRAGFIRGIFGEREDGSHVFFGKIVGVDGRFKGLMKGTYGNGEFDGLFHRNRTTVWGAVHGRAVTAAQGQDRAMGFFRGRWSQLCGEVDGEQ